MELTNKEKIKIIKTNLHLKDYKLALKLEINKYELHKFCIQNKIKLAPEKYIVKYIKSNPNMSLGIIRRTTGFNKEEINKLMGNNPTCRINAYKTNKNMKKEKIINNDDKYNIEKASVEVIKLLFKDKPNCSRKQYASILGISERTLYRHMVKYKISENSNDSQNNETEDANIEIPYNKVSNIELNEIISSIDITATKFIADLKLLNIGDALQIKKEDWKLNKIHFYFKNITRNTDLKVKVKDIKDFYYVIRKA